MRVLAGAVVVILAAGCGSSRPVTTTTAPATTTSSGVTLASPRVQQIALARASNDLLSIFPARPGTKRCTIPGGGLRTTPLRGTCTTRIRYANTHEPGLVVTFTEAWTVPQCSRGAECLSRMFHHTWTLAETPPLGDPVGSHLRVWPARQSGSTAPQYYK